MDIFADRLRELRESYNLTRQKVADDLGITRSSLEFYEKGKRSPNIEMIAILSEYYQVSSDYLIGISDVSTLDKDYRFVCEYTGLSELTVKELHLSILRSKSILAKEVTK